jgi:hypothetical protein
MFQSALGPNWEELDDDDLKIFAPDKDREDHTDLEQIYCLNLAKMKHDNAVWHTCHALPAHRELSHSESWYYPLERVQYHSNWRDLKVFYGVDTSLPMLFKPSPLKLSLTWKYGEKGGYIIDKDGKLVLGRLLSSTECEPALDTGVSEGETEEPQTPPRSPPCVPGMRNDDELEGVCLYRST